MALKEGQRIRFLRDSRHRDPKTGRPEWMKGRFAQVEKVIATKAINLSDLYIVRTDSGKFWITGEDIEPFNQLTLF